MKKTKVKVKKLKDNAILPTYGSEMAAGADLYAALDEPMEIKSGETKFVPTGLSFEFEEGLAGLIYARSGLSCKQGLAPANKVGVIDSDYRGEIMVALHNHSNQTRVVKSGDRIAQIVFTPYYLAEFLESENLSDTGRGQGGFGSTGSK